MLLLIDLALNGLVVALFLIKLSLRRVSHMVFPNIVMAIDSALWELRKRALHWTVLRTQALSRVVHELSAKSVIWRFCQRGHILASKRRYISLCSIGSTLLTCVLLGALRRTSMLLRSNWEGLGRRWVSLVFFLLFILSYFVQVFAKGNMLRVLTHIVNVSLILVFLSLVSFDDFRDSFECPILHL